MARYLIEVKHEVETTACARAVKILLESGSHFLTRADFGCRDGEHAAWIVVDVETKEEARHMLPPAYRAGARIVALNRFDVEEMDQILRYHNARPA